MSWHRETSNYAYEILWRASKTAIRAASAENARDDHLAIHALLCGFLAFEGFINFVGSEIAPDAREDERAFFSKNPYRGILGKVEYLFSLFPPGLLKKGEEPFESVRKLNSTRNALAHNRVVTRMEISESEDPNWFVPWEDFDSTAKVAAALEKLQSFADTVRLEALKLCRQNSAETYDLHLNFEAFAGPVGSAMGHQGG
jgi:hypothetical protein